MKKNIIAGLDIGTTKVCSIIAEKNDDSIDILGFGVVPSEGLSKGLVVNISKTAEAIKKAMEIAANRAGIDIRAVNVGVSGEHITSQKNRNYVTINNPEKEITKEDLDRLEQDVRTVSIPVDKQILHIIPEEYAVDYQGGIENPIGMSGSRLEAINQIVLASIPVMQNIKRSVERAGYQINDYVLQPIASSVSVLDENERDLGVVLIDIGGGTTDIAIFHNRSMKHIKVLGIAGNHVTNDIREYLGIVTDEAEKLKREFGYALESAIIKNEDIFLRGVGARGNVKIPVSLLTQIIHARMKELFVLIDNEIKQSGLKSKIKAGVVLTGGGALLRGATELATEVFGLPTRIGLPLDLGKGLSLEIESPEYATVSGLIKGFPNASNAETVQVEVKEKKKKKPRKEIPINTGKIGELFQKAKDIFNEL